MRKPSAALLVAGLTAAGSLASQDTTIRADQAKAFVGQAVTIENVVAHVSREPQSGFTYLTFGGAFPIQIFRAIIPHSVERLLYASVLRADRVRVRGIPQLGAAGVAEIVSADPAQLAAAPGAVTKPSTAGVAPPPVSYRCQTASGGAVPHEGDDYTS
jgi:hypothetical protein